MQLSEETRRTTKKPNTSKLSDEWMEYIDGVNDLDELCDWLKDYGRMYSLYTQQRERMLHRVRARCRTECGYTPPKQKIRISEDEDVIIDNSEGMTAAEQSALKKQNDASLTAATKLMKAYSKAYSTAKKEGMLDCIDTDNEHAPEGLAEQYVEWKQFAFDSMKAAEPFDRQQEAFGQMIEYIVWQFPIAEQIERVRGLGLLSVGRVLGESGNLDNYETISKVYKYMGVAVDDKGRAQGYRGRDKTTEEHIIAKYPPKRRSILYVCGDSLLKNNKGRYKKLEAYRKELEHKKATEAGKVVYSAAASTRAFYEERGLKVAKRVAKGEKGMSCGHIALRASRVVQKRLLEDLWELWTGKMSRNRAHMPDDHASVNPDIMY